MTESIVVTLQQRISQSLKCRIKDNTELTVLRLLLAAVKQDQIDSGNIVDDSKLIVIVERMIKQRRDSIRHYQAASRLELAKQEESEIEILTTFLPPPLSSEAVEQAINEAVLQAQSIKDMGKVMAILKSQLGGRVDMSTVSALVRQKLSG